MTPTPAVVYTKAGCAHCDAIRAELVASGTAFREIDVEREPHVIPELLKLTRGRRIVPVVVRAGAIEVAPRGGSAF